MIESLSSFLPSLSSFSLFCSPLSVLLQRPFPLRVTFFYLPLSYTRFHCALSRCRFFSSTPSFIRSRVYSYCSGGAPPPYQ
ncbi:uncharacterized protein ASPGLDRAFT_1308621 [Aspergillus glaucus CBS 516.65]|uniref:Uncharacterized protein n=1 Tax=Aspergillus glaucus CBS 516.65 TaxID=1160497 RepID=A0A1L9VQ48_ASPGL|nr:hypothetical protein ASPGLDRAFT_1308621 [Aspergillus glaucus CBS 516.65]OJJ86039.1 hypothetical protein ASPGLDRAFT_1308621 [Aspergillus glaucus CBS 516.65]